MEKIKTIVLLLSMVLVVSCSAKGRMTELIVTSVEFDKPKQHNFAVSIDAIGLGGIVLVDTDLFESALKKSIEQTKIFDAIDTSENPQYELFVIVLRFESYNNAHANVMTSKWILQKDEKEIWSDTIVGNGTSNTFAGVKRMRNSAEDAAKDNILNGLKALSFVSLRPGD